MERQKCLFKWKGVVCLMARQKCTFKWQDKSERFNGKTKVNV